MCCLRAALGNGTPVWSAWIFNFLRCKSRVITLELPDTIYLPAQRMAEATRRPLADVLVGALEASLPSLEGLTP